MEDVVKVKGPSHFGMEDVVNGSWSHGQRDFFELSVLLLTISSLPLIYFRFYH
jgi:hypothetical protein